MVSATSLNFSKYPFLKELGLSESNLGCYRDGTWTGRGQQVTSVNPHNNEQVATVTCASLDDYNDCIAAMDKEKAKW